VYAMPAGLLSQSAFCGTGRTVPRRREYSPAVPPRAAAAAAPCGPRPAARHGSFVQRAQGAEVLHEIPVLIGLAAGRCPGGTGQAATERADETCRR